MDTTKTVTHISLCAGYGGIDLGLKRAIPHLRTIAFSEIEAFACANLVAKIEAGFLDAAPIWTDVKTFPWARFHGCVGILSGGYPCQPFSAAGKRLGKDDPRHLWPWIADGIRLCRPNVCFFENVEGHISLGLREVLGELEEIGYRTTWGVFSAAEVGAPHQRKRVFILAHDKHSRLEGFSKLCSTERRPNAGLLFGDGSCGEKLADNSGKGLQGNILGVFNSQGRKESCGSVGCGGGFGGEEELADASNSGRRKDRQQAQLWAGMPEQPPSDCWPTGARKGHQIWPSRPGQPQFAWEPPRVVGNANGMGPLDDEQPTQGRGAATVAESSAVVGDADHGRQSFGIDARSGGQTVGGGQSDVEQAESGQTEPSLGGDVDGPAGGMDYAELCVSGDNRTDELRLLGNGVVPATAERAFHVLSRRLFP